MPNMDGLLATKTIMEESAQRGRTPPQVIAVTANVYDSDKEACRQVGMCYFISKPIRMNVLEEALARCQPVGIQGTRKGRGIEK